MKNWTIKAKSAEEASEKYIARKNKSGRPACMTPFGEWNGRTITYNGRVWNVDGDLIYDPV